MSQTLAPAAPAITLQSSIAPGIAAVKKYWQPFVLLQSAAFLLVLGYYTSGQIRSLCGQITDFKQHAGVIFVAISSAIAGGLLPELAKTILSRNLDFNPKRIRNVGFAMVAFGLNGILIDWQYRSFGWLLGQDNSAATVCKKVLLDQFVTTPLISIPYILLVYSLRANRYDAIKTLRQVSPRWYLTHAVPLLIPDWCFWIPMVALVYALPGPLQFCLFCFALAAWSLLVIFLATYEAGVPETAPDPASAPAA